MSIKVIRRMQFRRSGVFSLASGLAVAAVCFCSQKTQATPVITSQPADQVTVPGGAATFSVAASSSEPLTYQWFFNDANLIAGATNASLTLTNVQYTQAGLYSVQVADTDGSVASSNASLAFGWIVPSASATNQYVNGDGSFNSVTREQNVFGVFDMPAVPIIISELRFRPDESVGGPFSATLPDIQLSLSTSQSQPDHLNATFAANVGSNNTVVYSGSLSISTAFTTLSNGTMAFDIRLPLQTAFLYDPSQGNLLLDLQNFDGCAPAEGNFINIANSPSSSRLYSGDANGTTGSADSGGYITEVVYTRAPGPPVVTGQPTNQIVLIGGATTFLVSATGGAPLSYQWYFVPTNNSGQAGAYAETIDGFCYAAVVTNGGFGYGNLPNVNFVGGGGSGAAGYYTISNAVLTGITVTNAGSGYTNPPAVVIDAPNGYLYDETNSTLNITNANQSDLGNYFVVVSNSVGSVTSSVVNLTLLYPPSIVQSPEGFTGSFNSSNILSVVASGTPPLSYQWMFDGTNLVGATDTNYVITNLTSDTAGTYSVEVTNLYGVAVSSSALVALFPTLISPFTGAVEIWGQNAILNVGAVGSGSLSYQWYFNGGEIAGATNDSYDLNSIQFTNAGLYNVVVSSEYGSVTNTAYEVVVNPANVSIGLYAGVTIQGTVGNNYIIQSTTNLSDPNSWVTVTNITLTSPIQIWDDNSSQVNSPGNPQKYYQVLPGQ